MSGSSPQSTKRRPLWALLTLSAVLSAHSAYAFTDGSGYQIFLAVRSSVVELKKQLEELKQARASLSMLNELSLEDASTVVRTEHDRYRAVRREIDQLREQAGVADAQDTRLGQSPDATYIIRLEESVRHLQNLAQTPKRQRLLYLAQEKLKRMRQQDLLNNYSLSDRQARDMQTDLLLELVNHERERRAREHRERLRAQRYRDGLSSFLY